MSQLSKEKRKEMPSLIIRITMDEKTLPCDYKRCCYVCVTIIFPFFFFLFVVVESLVIELSVKLKKVKEGHCWLVNFFLS